MLTAKYSAGNVVLLLLAAVVAFGCGWVSVMTMAFRADPVHDLRSGVVMVVLWLAFVLVPASAIAAKWTRLGATICWSAMALRCISVWASPAVLLVLIPAAMEGLITTAIASRSQGNLPATIVLK